MLVFPLGTMVDIEKDIQGKIVGIQLDQNGTMYKIAWWNGRERKCDWLYDIEILRFSEPKSVQIGFIENAK